MTASIPASDPPPPLESPNSPNPGATGTHGTAPVAIGSIGDLSLSPVIPSSLDDSTNAAAGTGTAETGTGTGEEGGAAGESSGQGLGVAGAGLDEKAQTTGGGETGTGTVGTVGTGTTATTGTTTKEPAKSEVDALSKSNPPAASTPAPPATTSSPTSPSNPKGKASSVKKQSSSWLACFPCFSSSNFDEKPSPAASTSKPTPPPPASNTNTNTTPTDPNSANTFSEKSPAVTSDPTSQPTSKSIDDSTSSQRITPAPGATPTTGVPLPLSETEGVTSGAVQPPGSSSSTSTSPPPPTPIKKRRKSGKTPVDQNIITSVPEPGMPQIRKPHTQDDETDDESGSDGSDEGSEEDEEDEEQGLIARGGVGIPIGEDGLPHPLLAELAPEYKGRKCLVLDLDETLVHSSFKMVHQADYVVPVEIENQYHNVYVIKRPGVDAFLKAMGEIYEIVIFTASLSKYADPVLDQLDIHQVVKHRLFRESCYNNKGNYVKDLSQLGRPIEECIIIDNSPASYVFHPNNAVPTSSWFNDPHDTELTDLVPFLTDLATVDDIRSVLDQTLNNQHF